MDLYEEFAALIHAIHREDLDYAVVGALAVAIYGAPRATTDIDLLVAPDDMERFRQLARSQGFVLEALPFTFSDGMSLKRLTKVEAEESLTLDLLEVNPNLEGAWRSRRWTATEFGKVSVISREALIGMKTLAGRSRDISDIERLQENDR